MRITVDQSKVDAIANAKRVEELKSLLTASDYKVMPDYDKPSVEVREQRQVWRTELRKLTT
jgi:hypothetical protein